MTEDQLNKAKLIKRTIDSCNYEISEIESSSNVYLIPNDMFIRHNKEKIDYLESLLDQLNEEFKSL